MSTYVINPLRVELGTRTELDGAKRDHFVEVAEDRLFNLLQDTSRPNPPEILFLDAGANLSDDFTMKWRTFVASMTPEQAGVAVWYGNIHSLTPSGSVSGLLHRPSFGRCRSLYDPYAFRNCILRTANIPDGFIRQVSSSKGLIAAVEDLAIRGDVRVDHFEGLIVGLEDVRLKNLRNEPLFVSNEQSPIDFTYVVNPLGNSVAAPIQRSPSNVSVIIPTRGDTKTIWGVQTNLILNVVESVLAHSRGHEPEIVVVHDVNENLGPNLNSLKAMSGRVKVIDFDRSFNFSSKCNVGAANASGDVFVFMNDDVQVRESWWLQHLCGLLDLDGVGVVGPLLLLEDGRVQSAGHIDSPLPTNFGAGLPIRSLPKFEQADHPREVSSISAAVLTVGREIFEAVGGFTIGLPNNFNDIDFCLKVRSIDKSIVWTPLTSMYHFESLSRESAVSEAELNFLNRRWGRLFKNDQYRYRLDSLQKTI